MRAVGIWCVIRRALARHCKVEESMRTTTTGASRGRMGGSEGERGGGSSFGCRRKEKHFAAAFLSHARCKIHRITPTACSYNGEEREGGGQARLRERKREGISYLRTSKLFHRLLARPSPSPPPSELPCSALSMALGHKRRRIGHYRCSRLPWCKLGIARKQRQAPENRKVSLKIRNFSPKRPSSRATREVE